MTRFGLVPEIAKKAYPWGHVLAIAPPPGQEDSIGFLDAIIDDQTGFGRGFRFYVQFEGDDLERLKNGGFLEFTMLSMQMVPVAVQVIGPPASPSKPLDIHEPRCFHDEPDMKQPMSACDACRKLPTLQHWKDDWHRWLEANPTSEEAQYLARVYPDEFLFPYKKVADDNDQ